MGMGNGGRRRVFGGGGRVRKKWIKGRKGEARVEAEGIVERQKVVGRVRGRLWRGRMGLEEAEAGCGETEWGLKRLREIVERLNAVGRG